MSKTDFVLTIWSIIGIFVLVVLSVYLVIAVFSSLPFLMPRRRSVIKIGEDPAVLEQDKFSFGGISAD